VIIKDDLLVMLVDVAVLIVPLMAFPLSLYIGLQFVVMPVARSVARGMRE
jgi:hypothetical protein